MVMFKTGVNITGLIIGELPETVHKDPHYFLSREMIVDCRGYLTIHKDAHFGRGVKIITLSHSAVGQKEWKRKTTRTGVTIEKNVFINAYAILYNTKIEEGSIVSAGSVVLGRNIAPNVIVAGNPAVVIARWKGDHWAYDRKYYGRLE